MDKIKFVSAKSDLKLIDIVKKLNGADNRNAYNIFKNLLPNIESEEEIQVLDGQYISYYNDIDDIRLLVDMKTYYLFKVDNMIRYMEKPALRQKRDGEDIFEDNIIRLLGEVGISSTSSGYSYLIEAISIVLRDEEKLKNIVDDIYKAIARKHNATWQSIEIAIRRSIKSAFSKTKMEVLSEIFGLEIDTKRVTPYTSEFIEIIVHRIKIDL